MVSKRSLWTCPKCKQQFVTPNMWHSCGNFTVEQFLRGKSPQAKELYRQFVAFVQRCGPITISPAKTRISFQARVRFAGVTKVSDQGLTGGFWLKRRIESPRFTRVEFIPPNNFVYQFLIKSSQDLDNEALGWIKEAYSVGTQEQLRSTSAKSRA